MPCRASRQALMAHWSTPNDHFPFRLPGHSNDTPAAEHRGRAAPCAPPPDRCQRAGVAGRAGFPVAVRHPAAPDLGGHSDRNSRQEPGAGAVRPQGGPQQQNRAQARTGARRNCRAVRRRKPGCARRDRGADAPRRSRRPRNRQVAPDRGQGQARPR